ncbi:ABC transporter permease [Streptomonospora nanhaiensis]|uniref:Peptide/nickel transport system permease protein n=1 Tax=Streptomonospora nanhaiensis TaxID=1323731 RepID=A0A853BT83_9ACTN|nr:ABC transporter permease [Streptomonospora nanhaiensis]MBV2365832.1 ABC transporter permease [Streptomonospora nanhaiensis]MBX9390338.1 ABC transporter permease [Streptomonospora nanhaiensis]NYI98134.1 peptide/nickel transport system permease protein [Streptomonospora nanhaiensis]
MSLATATAPESAAAAPPGRRQGLFRAAWRHGRTRIGVVLVGLVVLTAVAGPFLSPYSPTELVGIPNRTGVEGTVFGTDGIGRDVLSRFLHGGYTLITIAVSAALVGVVLGAAVGVVAGYRRGWLDEAVMRTNDMVLAFPQLVLALLVMSIIGPEVWLIIALIGVSHASRVARVAREATLKVVEQDFVKSAEAIGVPGWRIMGGEILPNITSPLLVELGLRITYSVGLIATLSFLGMGLQPPTADWGLMINENRIAITVQPWSVVLPVAAVALLTIGANLITDGLSRASIGIDRGVEK